MKFFYTNISLTFLLLIIGSRGSAQQFNETPEFLNANSHWIFGTNAGLDFSSGTATAMMTISDAKEGPATVSDPVTGELLFYSNGQDCRNRLGGIMPNGDSLMGNSNFSTGTRESTITTGGRSTAQGTLIAPVIGDPSRFYLFSLLGPTNFQANYSQGSLFYSIVDMSLEGGLGDISLTAKNIPISYDTLSESMIVLPGNNCDLWLIVHAFEDPEFLAYHITAEGIDTVPVVSNTGGGSQFFAYIISWMAGSPDRSKIGLTYGDRSLIAEFDPNTGQISNPVTLAGLSGDLCFSPNNSKLYALGTGYLTQFDISVHDSLAVNNSKVPILSAGISDLRLYNDTIYFKNNGNYFHRINQPNLTGLACDLEMDAIMQLSGTSGGNQGMGSDVVFPFAPDTLGFLALDTTVCPRSGSMFLEPTTLYDDLEWNDGSTEPILEVTDPGVYWVTQNAGCERYVDTFIISNFDFPVPTITINVLELGTVATYSTYQWILNGNAIPNAVQSTYDVLENGFYQVVVTNEAGCIDTSEVYEVSNAEEGSSIQEMQDLRNRIQIYPVPTRDIVNINSPVPVHAQLVSVEGKVLNRVEGAGHIDLSDRSSGVYLLKIYDMHYRLIKWEKILKIAQ